MTFDPIRLGRYRCDPRPARTLAQELRELSKAAGATEDVYAAGFGLDRRGFEGEAGDSFRARCKLRLATAAELRHHLRSLSDAADELALDARDIVTLLDELVAIARRGGLVVSDDAIHPPHDTVRREDSPALVQGWQAWDQLTARHAAVDATYDRTVDDWLHALARHGYSEWAQRSVPPGPWVPDWHRDQGSGPPREPGLCDVLPPPAAPPVTGPPAAGERPRFDEDSRARWIEGHRGRDGEWVHGRWKPFGRDGHFPVVLATWGPHAGEHPSGATTARWLDGRWEPVVPEARPPWIA